VTPCYLNTKCYSDCQCYLGSKYYLGCKCYLNSKCYSNSKKCYLGSGCHLGCKCCLSSQCYSATKIRMLLRLQMLLNTKIILTMLLRFRMLLRMHMLLWLFDCTCYSDSKQQAENFDTSADNSDNSVFPRKLSHKCKQLSFKQHNTFFNSMLNAHPTRLVACHLSTFKRSIRILHQASIDLFC